MVYIDSILIVLGLTLYIYKDIFKFPNYYLGHYFNKAFGVALVLFNSIAIVLFLIYKVQLSFIFTPLLIAYVLTKTTEYDFNYTLVKDDYYEEKEKNKPHRHTVRAIVMNSKHQVGLVHIVYNDPLFGYRDHYELPGGGVEENEIPINALHREIEEELGYSIKNIHYLCKTGIEYNPFNRIDDSDIFVCQVDEKKETNYQGLEKEFIKEIVFVNIYDLKKIYKENKQDKVGKMIYKRDGRLLNLYMKCH